MSLESVAKAYTACVELEERARHESVELAENAAVLRSDLHALLMDALRQANIPFANRSDAARIAFEIIQGKRNITAHAGASIRDR